jgi:hypothetical protein
MASYVMEEQHLNDSVFTSEIRVAFDKNAKKTINIIKKKAFNDGILQNLQNTKAENPFDIIPDQNILRDILEDNKYNFTFIKNENSNITWHNPEIFACMLAIHISDSQLESATSWQDVRDYYIFINESYNYNNEPDENQGARCACGHLIRHLYIAQLRDNMNIQRIIGRDCALKHKLITKEENSKLAKNEKLHRDFFICKVCQKRCGDKKAIHESQIQTCQNCIVENKRKERQSRKNIYSKKRQADRKNNPKCQIPNCNYQLNYLSTYRTCYKHKGYPLPESILCDSCDNTLPSFHKTRTCIECKPNIEKACEGCDKLIEVAHHEVSWKKKCHECYYSDKLKSIIEDEKFLNENGILEYEFDLE